MDACVFACVCDIYTLHYTTDMDPLHIAYRSRRAEDILDLLPSLGALAACSSEIRLGEGEREKGRYGGGLKHCQLVMDTSGVGDGRRVSSENVVVKALSHLATSMLLRIPASLETISMACRGA